MSLRCAGFFRIGARSRRSRSTSPLAPTSGDVRSAMSFPRAFPACDCTSRSTARRPAGPFDLHVEGRRQRVPFHGRKDAAKLGERRVARGRRLEDPRLEVLLDHPVDRHRALAGADGELLEIEVVFANRNPTGQLLQREVRRVAAEPQVLHPDAVVHRRVFEAGLDVQAVDARGQPVSARPTLSSIATVPSVSSIDGSDMRRPGPLRSASCACFFDQAPQIPAVRVARTMSGSGRSP